MIKAKNESAHFTPGDGNIYYKLRLGTKERRTLAGWWLSDSWEPLKIQFSDETTSHLTKAASCQVIGYKQGKARTKNCAAAYVDM